MNELQRRYDSNRHTEAEKAISHALTLVERLGCDTRLTEAACLLGEAQNKVADFVDGTN